MKYKIIYADPPWSYKAKNPPCKLEKQPETVSVNYYYDTMSIDDIKKFPIDRIADKDCVLFMWATTPLLPEAFDTLKAWGFKYKTMITWEKTNNDCMGYWFRVCTEHLLVAVKGKEIKSFRSMIRTLYRSPRGKHSEKPNYFHQLIEEVTTNIPNAKKIELFARKEYDGWDAFGNEVENSIII
jgi:N6-adenosine-specific RNA methylase IME4